jgi:hypothetical protein
MGVVTLDQVERQIARGFRLLRFAPDIEAAFRKDYAAERVRLAAIWGVVGTLIYDLVYFGDRTMMADVFSELVVLRFLVFTPFVIGCILAVRRWPHALFYDILSIAIAVLGVTLPMAAATQSASPYLFVYQNGNSAAFLFFVIALRPRFPAVLAGLVLMCASHFTTTQMTGAFDAVTYSGIVTFYVTLSIFLAVSAYFLEQKDRQNFLNQLRGSLLYRQLEHNSERDELTGLLKGCVATRCTVSRPSCSTSITSSGSTTFTAISRVMHACAPSRNAFATRWTRHRSCSASAGRRCWCSPSIGSRLRRWRWRSASAPRSRALPCAIAGSTAAA